MKLSYWMARILGRADGPRVTRCAGCGELAARDRLVTVLGAHGLFHDEDCAALQHENLAW